MADPTKMEANAREAINDIEAEIIKGLQFNFSHRFNNVANNDTVKFLIITSADPPCVHFIINSEGGFTVDIREAPTVSDNGSAVTGYNMKRSDTEHSVSSTCFYAPTASSDGDIIFQTAIGAERHGAGFASSHWILKADTKYVVELKNASTNVSDVAIELLLSEEI